MATEKPSQALDATALVHEAYLRLVGSGTQDQWAGRGHFFSAATEAIRRILIEAARRKSGPVRGGNRKRIAEDLDQLSADSDHPALLDLDEALSSSSQESGRTSHGCRDASDRPTQAQQRGRKARRT